MLASKLCNIVYFAIRNKKMAKPITERVEQSSAFHNIAVKRVVACNISTQEESQSGRAPMYTALWQRKRTQRCASDGADSNVTALEQQW